MAELPISQAPPSPGGSLRNKFIRTMLIVSSIIGGVTLAIVLFLSARSSAQHLRAIEGSIEEGITSKGKVLTENHALALHGMILDNAFLDMQTLLARAISQDPDLVYGLFVNSDGEALAFQKRGAPTSDAAPEKDAWRVLGLEQKEVVARKETIRRAVRLDQEVVEVAEPVIGEDHEVLGTIRYGLSTRRMHQALAVAAAESKSQQINSIALIGAAVGLATLLGVLLSRIQAVRITQPVQALTQAAIDLAAGERSVRVSINSGDELQVLGYSFNRMVEELKVSYGELEEMNRTLEHKVEERTLALAGRNRDMRLVLDNVDQGFITLSMDGVMARERSAVVDRWFGTGPGVTFWQYLFATSPDFALGFELGWDQLTADVLPYEVALEQLPSRLNANGKSFSLRYIPLLKDERLEGVLVVVADITDRLQREREEAELTEMMEAFRRLMLDRTGFLAFSNEATNMVKSVCGPDVTDGHALRSTLHTLKGNSAQMGLKVVAHLCHVLEDELAAGDGMKSQDLLARRWQALSEHVTQLVGDAGRSTMEVSANDYASLVNLLSRDGKSAALAELLTWKLEPAARPLGRLADQARALAARLGKGDVDIEVQAGNVRLDPDTYGPFFSDLVHLVRNAIDHGIESPEERPENKPPVGKMTFKAQTRDNRLVFEISDDGRGIDWAAITELGASLGLPSRTPAERLAILCRQGVTTRTDVSETSGRGVGMSAIKQRIDAMHGRLDVESSGNGTKWTISLPWAPEMTEQQIRRTVARTAAR
ncbi:MAG TPA: ATP-binding protein [Polyangiaceae bacterium]|nr:ATP-binding protein [Polyangiaceae bacterium]